MVALKRGKIKCFEIGNLKTKKDWGFAGDYAVGMHMMLQSKNAKDYILATGESHSIEDFIEVCAQKLEIPNWRKHIVVNNSICKRKNSGSLIGNSDSIETEPGGSRTKNFEELVGYMIDFELGDE